MPERICKSRNSAGRELRYRLQDWLAHPVGARIREGRVVVDTKQQILKAIEELPDDAGIEDALDRLYLLYKVEKGLRQADADELISQEEVRQRMGRWLK